MVGPLPSSSAVVAMLCFVASLHEHQGGDNKGVRWGSIGTDHRSFARPWDCLGSRAGAGAPKRCCEKQRRTPAEQQAGHQSEMQFREEEVSWNVWPRHPA